MHTQPLFQGVYASNKLKDVVIKRESDFFVICNTNPDTVKTSGHWTACYYCSETCELNYYDSLGNPPTGEILKFINELTPAFTYNKHRYQAYNSSNCGQLALTYCDIRCLKFSDQEALEIFSTTNLKLNDSLAQAYVYGHMTSPI